MQTDFHASSRIVLGRGATDSKRALVTLSLVFVLVIIDSISVITYLAYHYSHPTLIEQLKVLELSHVKKGCIRMKVVVSTWCVVIIFTFAMLMPN